MELRSVQSVGQLSILPLSENRLAFGEQGTQKINNSASTQTDAKSEANHETETTLEEQKKVNDFSAVEADLQRQLKELDDMKNVALKFSIDQETKQLILSMIDAKSNQVLRQIPNDLALKIMKFFSSKLESGSVTDAKV